MRRTQREINYFLVVGVGLMVISALTFYINVYVSLGHALLGLINLITFYCENKKNKID